MSLAPTSPVRLVPPPDGCEVAVSCVLEIAVTAPLSPGPAAPVVRQADGLEVLTVTPGGGHAPWVVRTLAFAAGDAALPIVGVNVIDRDGTSGFRETPPGTVHVTGRTLPADAALAGLEGLAPATNPWFWVTVVAASVGLGAAGLVATWASARLVVPVSHLVTPLRVRWNAGRLVRRAARHVDARQPYHRIVAALRLVLTYRAGRPVAALTASELAALVAGLGLDRRACDQITALLAKTDAVRFGRRVPAVEEITADLATARALVTSRRLVRRSRPS